MRSPPTFIRVVKAEEDDQEQDSFYPLNKLIRVADIRDVDELDYDNDNEQDFKGCLINFYDGDNMMVFDSLDELYNKLEGK